jgi:signal transduction histidine kinase
LIDNVLDLTQSDTGGLLLAEEDVDLADLCGELAEEMKGLAGRKGVELEAQVKPKVGIVTGDRRRLSQAVGNILRNALLYTEAGGRVLLLAEGGRDAARIIVSDNGRGIAPSDQARVFDRFQRTAEGRSEEQAAIGLGLPLARQFIEAHGGTIQLQSTEGEGTTVTIRLPRTAEQRADYATARVAE